MKNESNLVDFIRKASVDCSQIESPNHSNNKKYTTYYQSRPYLKGEMKLIFAAHIGKY